MNQSLRRLKPSLDKLSIAIFQIQGEAYSRRSAADQKHQLEELRQAMLATMEAIENDKKLQEKLPSDDLLRHLYNHHITKSIKPTEDQVKALNSVGKLQYDGELWTLDSLQKACKD